MRSRFLPSLLAAGACALAAAPSAGAASVAYIDGGNAQLSSPDGAAKLTLTAGGTSEAPWQSPSQGPDGKTVVVHRDTFEGGSKRPVLYLYGADGKLVTANVMPVYSGAGLPVYPVGLDMDWNSQAVAYGFSYCGFGCTSLYRGYWLTFSDNQGAYPSNPQGQSDAFLPTFYGKRVVSSDSGGRIFVQPDVAGAPFTTGNQGWLEIPGVHLSRAEVSSAPANLVAVEWSRSSDGARGIVVGRHQGTVPSDVTQLCDLPVAADSGSVSFSPDGTMVTWADAEGVKVAGVPNLAAGTSTCTLTSPPVLISATGKQPSFGGADVAAMLKANGAGGGTGQGGGAGSATTTPSGGGAGTTATTTTSKPSTDAPAPVVQLRLSGAATHSAFRKGLTLKVTVPAAGKVAASATVPASVAKKLRLGGATTSRVLASAASSRGFAAASKAAVVARGTATAKQTGTVTLTLRPTAKARRAASRLRGAKLTIRVTQGAAAGTTSVTLK